MAPAETDAVPQPGGGLAIEVALSPGPRQMHLVAMTLPRGATVQQALDASGLIGGLGEGGDSARPLHIGIWGRKTTLDTVLRDGDRVECYRGLTVDPKEARRLRYRSHGEKLPKGIHRPRDRVVDLSQAPDKRRIDPAD